jgi:sulfur carrier protein
MGSKPYPFRPVYQVWLRDAVFCFMRLTINGELFEMADPGTVYKLLNELKIEPAGVAVEVNFCIVKKMDYPTFMLNEGDEIEIVNFVGGG